MTEKKMERKIFPALVTKADEEQGIIEAVFAVFGNVDEGDDVVHPGAFAKTFTERGHKVRVLDNHQASSIMNAIGKPLVLAEVGREQLPPKILEKYPEATGGAFARVQMLMDTPEGKGAFVRLRDGVVDEWSFGYDALDYDYTKVNRDGRDVTVRNLRTLKLWEISPVLWGMNPATATTAAKNRPTEGKPWDTFPVGGQFCVFRVDADGNRTGDALGCHDTESAARQQVEALYASEQSGGEGAETEKAPMKTEVDGKHPAGHYLVVEDPQKPSTWHLRVRDVDGSLSHRLMGAAWAALHGGYRGNRYQGPGKQEAIRKLRRLYEQEDMDVPGESALDIDSTIESLLAESFRLGVKEGHLLGMANVEEIKSAVTILLESLRAAGIDIEQGKARPSPGEPLTSEEAEPEDKATPTDELLTLIEIEQAEISIMEV